MCNCLVTQKCGDPYKSCIGGSNTYGPNTLEPHILESYYIIIIVIVISLVLPLIIAAVYSYYRRVHRKKTSGSSICSLYANDQCCSKSTAKYLSYQCKSSSCHWISNPRSIPTYLWTSSKWDNRKMNKNNTPHYFKLKDKRVLPLYCPKMVRIKIYEIHWWTTKCVRQNSIIIDFNW